MVKPVAAISKKANISSEGIVSKTSQQSNSLKTSTSFLMPTIVGKSVKGSAMQAVAMSRARARRSNPSRPMMTGKPTKPSTGTTKPTQRIMNKSTWKAQKTKKSLESQKAQDKDVLRFLPSALAKEYTVFQSSIIKSSPNGSVSSMLHQRFFQSWLSKSKDKEMSPQSVHFILSHANLLHVQSFYLVKSALNHSYQFLQYVVKVILSQDKNTTFLAKNFSRDTSQLNTFDGGIDQSIFIMRKIKHTMLGKGVVVIHEISIQNHNKLGKFCRCRSWSLLSSDEGSKTFFLSNSGYGLLSNFNIHGEIFNFACTRSMKSLEHSSGNLNVSSILREAQRIFPSHVQAK